MAQHHVSIAWDASADTVNGYWVYRSETQGAESTSTTPINSAIATGTVYEDDTVQVGHVYYYEVRSDANGVLSVVSNEVASTVLLPLPPTNVHLAEVV